MRAGSAEAEGEIRPLEADTASRPRASAAPTGRSNVRHRRGVLAGILAGAAALAASVAAVVVLSTGAPAAAKPTKPEPNQCVVESDNPQPPHLVDLCHWDGGRQAWVRQYDGHTVVASAIPHQVSMMCLWLGCPPPASRKRGSQP